MLLNDLLLAKRIDPKKVIVMRHRPTEVALRKALPWMAAENPKLFNAYQQTQTRSAERALAKAEYLAAFIGHEAGKAVFAGLYKVRQTRTITATEYRRTYADLRKLGHMGQARSSMLWFDLKLVDFYAEWRGKLIVKWPKPERAWFRWADKKNNSMEVDAILSESVFVRSIADWTNLVLTWDELKLIPSSFREKLKEWRGVYLIFDVARMKFYVGSAYGRENIYGRWMNYSRQSHGGNKLLKQSNSSNLRFSILQRVSPDLEASEVIRIESSWKDRLLSREYGLNDN
jgi:hypothetical protein